MPKTSKPRKSKGARHQPLGLEIEADASANEVKPKSKPRGGAQKKKARAAQT